MNCQCIYDTHDEAHPKCERNNATCIVTFSWGNADILMCEWCANDWCQRHSSAEMIKVDSNTCHCGRSIYTYEDGSTRHMCEWCSDVRCDGPDYGLIVDCVNQVTREV